LDQKCISSTYVLLDVRTLHSGKLNPKLQQQAVEVGARGPTAYAARQDIYEEPLAERTVNLLNNLKFSLKDLLGLTKIEVNVQIPTCEIIAKNKNLQLRPNCS
jgi:hypothetical protein